MTGDLDQYEALAPLLPFYVNGTLSADDQARVEAGLADDAMLREELDEIRAIAELVREGGPALAPASGASSADRLEALLARIDAEPAIAALPPLAQPRRSLPWRRGGRVGQRHAPRQPGALWKPAFAAAAAVVVAQFGVIGYQTMTETQNSYTSLSGPSTPQSQSQAPGTAHLLVKLAPDARWADVAALLSRHDLAIVGGPHGDMLEIAVGADAQRDADVQALKASKLVTFVGLVS